MNLQRKSIEWFPFRRTLTGTELSITNHEVNGSLNSFQHIKIKKILKTDWPNVFSPTTWKPVLTGIRLEAESQRQLWCIILTPKNVHIHGPIFSKINITDLLRSTIQQAWLNPTTHSRNIGNLLFQSTMRMLGMPDHIQEKLHDQTAASTDILLDAKSKHFASNSFWDIKICNLTGWENFQLQLKN